jgi:hypothetical protein
MMADKVLIERLVAEVLARLHPATDRTRPAKPGLLLVYPAELEAKAVDVIEKELQAGWHVYHAQVEEMERVSLHRDVKQLVFLQVDQDLLMRGALGIAGTAASQLLADALLQGIPALLVPCTALKWLLDAKAGEAVLPAPARRYRQHIRTHADTLVTFGASLGSMADVFSLAEPTEIVEHEEEPGAPYAKPQSKASVFEGKVLTHSDVQQVKGNMLYVSPATVITPLARDVARTNGITIQIGER